MNFNELKKFLDEKYDKFNNLSFIENDPISIPHQFLRKEDIEISGFLAAIIATGKREMIISNAKKIMKSMDNSPFDFVNNCSILELKKLKNCGHRFINGDDLIFFVKSLKNIYNNYGGIEQIFNSNEEIFNGLKNFYEIFFSIAHPENTKRKIANVANGSAAKRLNLFLRWMIRNDDRGVDFGLWKNISPSKLYIPLDVHSAKISRELNLLLRKQNDWKAVEELTKNLRQFDTNDPTKYDFALFGVGVSRV